MSILSFKANLLGGGSRANQFRVTLSFPTFVAGGAAAASKSQFLCEAASLPGQTVNVTSVMYRGRQVKLAGERMFDNWTITVINDADFAIRNAFESWMNTINNLQENTGTTNPLSYTANMQVEQLDRNGVSLMTYTFADAWPTILAPIPLSFATNDVVETFDVQLAYSWFNTSGGGGSGVSVTAGIATPAGSIGASLP